MDSATAVRLDAINRDFYDRVGPEFSASRERLNPGILEAFRDREGIRSVLDVGCGDGRVGLAWAADELPMAWEARSRYVGLERSGSLLAARSPWPEGLTPVQIDLLRDGWPEGPFDLTCCFAVLHHVPDRAVRVSLLRRIARSLAPAGLWAVSVWQFLHLERFRRRIVDWAEVGVDPEGLEPGDLLLDWRRGPRALRYVHHYDPGELEEDCAAAGLSVSRKWSSDGQGQKLGLYVAGSLPTILDE
jgi:SAM-dependent methyltransferase